MWHTHLLQHIVQKIFKEDKELALALEYITRLFYLLRQCGYQPDDIEPSMVLGFIKDLYLFALHNKDRTIPLSEFARVSLGLLILHAKNSEETQLSFSQLLIIIQDYTVLKVLYSTPDNTLGKIAYQNDSFYIKELNKIEGEVFAKLNCRISANATELLHTLKLLLMEIDRRVEVISSLLVFLLSLSYEKSRVPPFVLEIEKLREQLTFTEICNQLDAYVKNSGEYTDWYTFYRHSVHWYAREVVQIQQMKLENTPSILKELHKIRIIHKKDKLLEIMNFFDQQNPDGVQPALKTLDV